MTLKMNNIAEVVRRMDTKSTDGTYDGRSRRILVIEDYAATAELIKTLLEEERYDVRCVSSARGALRILTDRRGSGSNWYPDLLLLDPTLPDVNDASFLVQFLEEQDGLPPVIVVSARPTQGLQDMAGYIRAAALIEKPFDIDVFLSYIGYVLAGKRMAGFSATEWPLAST